VTLRNYSGYRESYFYIVLVIVLGKVGVWYLLWALGGITMTNDRGLVGNFVDLCEFNWLDPKEVLEILNAQDWDADKEHIGKLSEEQLKEINRLMRQFGGEPTEEQLTAIVRSVMMPAAPACIVSN
jgi:hypothetical protein